MALAVLFRRLATLQRIQIDHGVKSSFYLMETKRVKVVVGFPVLLLKRLAVDLHC